jgi:hypothetical protein
MGSIERFVAHAAVAWSCLSTLAHAEEPDGEHRPSRAQCLAAHEQAQDARLASQLLSARSSLRECSAAACPALVSRDCVKWLSEVDQEIPSVIFRAAKDGEDLVALKVSEGERLLTDSLTGTPLELDPGPHTFVAELPGFAPQDATYVLQAGDKARVISFEFVTPKPAPPPGPVKAAPIPLFHARPAPRPIPRLSYVLAGATLTAAISGSVFGGLALAKHRNVQGRCAPLCDSDDVHGMQELALVSDISFALALVGAGATVFSYVTRPAVSRPEAIATGNLRLSLVWTGLGGAARGSF